MSRFATSVCVGGTRANVCLISTVSDRFRHDVNLFDPNAECGATLTAPASWYTSREFHAVEKDSVFKKNWMHVGNIHECAEPGQYFTGKIAKQPFVVVRGDDGELRAFYNVCSHHAARVAEGSGTCSEFVCPYHGWTYRHDGKLRKTTNMKGIKNFRPKFHGLKPIRIDTWGPFVFLNFSETPEPLHASLSRLDSYIGSVGGFSGLKFIKRREYNLDCNWKVFVDNYCDGGYHVPYAHEALAEYIDMGSYESFIHPKLSVQMVSKRDTDDGAGRLGHGACYAFCYPNLMVNRYGPWMDTNTVVPTGKATCKVTFDYYLQEDSGLSDSQVECALASSHRVQEEDEYLCHSVQSGLESDGYSQGRYVPRFETPMFAFHRWLYDDFITVIE